jgi:hypothetical protein
MSLCQRLDWALCHGCTSGDHSNWVFGLLPAVLTYPASGINTNLQWCGQGFSQLPNGIGFGGQVRPQRLLSWLHCRSCACLHTRTVGVYCFCSVQGVASRISGSCPASWVVDRLQTSMQ